MKINIASNSNLPLSNSTLQVNVNNNGLRPLSSLSFFHAHFVAYIFQPEQHQSIPLEHTFLFQYQTKQKQRKNGGCKSRRRLDEDLNHSNPDRKMVYVLCESLNHVGGWSHLHVQSLLRWHQRNIRLWPNNS